MREPESAAAPRNPAAEETLEHEAAALARPPLNPLDPRSARKEAQALEAQALESKTQESQPDEPPLPEGPCRAPSQEPESVEGDATGSGTEDSESATPTAHDRRELWARIQAALARRVQPEQFETWFRRAGLVSLDDHQVKIAVQNGFARKWLQDHYLETIEQAVHAVLGVKRSILLTVDPELAVPPEASSTQPPSVLAPSELGVAGNPTAPSSAEVPRSGEPTPGGVSPLVQPAAHQGGFPPSNGNPSSAGSPFGGTGPRTGAAQRNPDPGSLRDSMLGPAGGLLWNSDVVLNPKYTFENFVVGPCNRFGHAAAMGAGEQPGKHYNPFFLHGRVGVGKTHLLQAVCFAILSRWREARILYLSCETFVNHFIAALENGDLAEFRNKYRQVDVLVVDDIHLLANKERTQEEFFHTFNTLYNAGKQIVLSSDSPPKDIPTLQERLVSRFKWGMVTEIEPPCYETRMAIVKRKSRDRNTNVPDDVAQLIAEHIDENVRELEGAVTRLIGYSSLTGREITLELAREGLADLLHVRRGAPSMDDIIQEVTQHFGVKLSELQSKKRTKSIAYPRQVAMYLARKVTRHSLEEIGGWFGGRDHSTVLYAVDRIGSRLTSDPACKQSVEELLGRLQGGHSS